MPKAINKPQAAPPKAKLLPKSAKVLPANQINLKEHSIEELFALATDLYHKNLPSTTKLNQIISKAGTRKDRINLMATEILKHPDSSLQKIDQLMKWCFDHNHNFAIDSAKVLVNLYTEHILVDRPQLYIFMESVQSKIKESKKSSQVERTELIGFYIEHHLKHYYGQLVKSIEMMLTSNISFVKKTSITLLATLTRFKELRRMIINILINKFGDQDMEIVNDVSKALKKQFYEDLQSSETLLEEAAVFLFRQNLGQKAQFYVVNFLNNLNMKFLTEKSINKLFQLFYHFFQRLMDKENQVGSISSRLFLNSIKGLNKIFVFIKGGSKHTKEIVEAKIESVYKIVHKTTNTKAKIQLLLFLFQGHSHLHGSLPDRYFRILYEFIGTEEILRCSLVEVFFDLLLVSIKQDTNMNRSWAFLKRILQLCLGGQTNFIVTCLLLIGRILKEKQSLLVLIKQKQNALQESEDEVLKYDINKREPIYCHAENTCLWELLAFTNHYHPTVRKFATHLLNGEQIPYDGNNPLIELSQTSFLQKMALRKEKKSDSWKIKVNKNISKIRKSKYETLIDKPIDSFKEDEEFIKKYLTKRAVIHTNMKKMQANDIEDFADQVIEREMDRLNPKEDQMDDSLSISKEPSEDEGEFQDGFEGDENDEDMEGEDDLENEDRDEQEDQEFGSNESFEDQDNSDGGFSEDQNMEESESQKGFGQAFDEIGQEDDYPKKKKKIGKPFGKKNAKFQPRGKQGRRK